MEGLTEGRIVHYVMPSGEHRPAIVVRVWNIATSPGMVNLVVFTDGWNDIKPSERSDTILTCTLWESSVSFDDSAIANGTWHWIEKA